MTDPTALDWHPLTDDQIEAIEAALDDWERAKLDNRYWEPASCGLAQPLVPYVEERIRELSKLDQFIDQFDRGSPELPTVKEIGPVRITGIISRRLTCDVYKGLQNNPRRDVAVKV
ncbi:MAG: hypothetical protein KDB00_15140, partial [Planctomycetales bacterium]|nr:hypothetical protein [Planctomycetales bacterium]